MAVFPSIEVHQNIELFMKYKLQRCREFRFVLMIGSRYIYIDHSRTASRTDSEEVHLQYLNEILASIYVRYKSIYV